MTTITDVGHYARMADTFDENYEDWGPATTVLIVAIVVALGAACNVVSLARRIFGRA